MLIRTFGEFWNPDTVDWGSKGAGNKGRLLGKAKKDGLTREVDFWGQVGLYILHDDFRTV